MTILQSIQLLRAKIMKNIKYKLNGQEQDLFVSGETGYGENVVLLLGDDNLIKNTDFNDCGYSVNRFLDDESYDNFCLGIQKIFSKLISKATSIQVDVNFKLENYHEVIKTDELHAKIINYLREGFPLDSLPIPLQLIEERVSEICGVDVIAYNSKLPDQNFYVRVVRPNGKNDNNPPHRDVWLDYYRNCVNIYLPICGSNELSALPMVPGSHLWSESDIERTLNGATIKGYSYRVPSVTSSKNAMDFIRPNPSRNEMIVFSPYLIHGGGVNLNQSTTRMSLEMRFFRK